ncbi:hypothetical protein G3823_005276 [Escherichia coli]|nr:hypothetical protein [Escherichia coli]EFI8984905.1 hypothetical protein [Escherichia coli]EFI9569106.1 hypothetical protein [Escherichia coli]EFJ0493235.1 hypothetical protein [Escherichia coli]EFJ1100379.1 hypothetical protein [Escherichia coli]
MPNHDRFRCHFALWIPSAHSPVENMGWLKCSGIRSSYLGNPSPYILY